MSLLKQYQTLFDHVERLPLTLNQRQACVSSAINTLVLAGAGTGKTSTLMGRLAYLLQSQQAQASEILLLAFAVEAANEMQERGQALKTGQSLTGYKARTFHSLGLYIVNTVNKGTSQLSKLSQDGELDKFLQAKFQSLLEQQAAYARAVQDYFTFYEKPLARSRLVNKQLVSSIPLISYRSLADEYLNNSLELIVANTLYQVGLDYVYQAHYARNVYLAAYQPYRVSFYIKPHGLSVLVYDCLEHEINELSQLEHYSRYRVLSRKAHQQDNYPLLEIYQDRICDGLTQEVLCALEPELFTSTKPDLLTATQSDAQQDLCWAKAHQAMLMNYLSKTSKAMRPSQGGQSPLEIEVGNDSYYQDHSYKPLCRSPGRTHHLVALLSDLLMLVHHEGLSSSPQQEELTPSEQHLWDLMQPLYLAYRQALREEGAIDFELMIQQATEYIRSAQFQVPWTDVLIDEFQDISSSRFALIQAMREQRPDIRLFCVGDDWQAIYQFAGSQIRYTRDFECYFGETERHTLDLTFRFHQALCDSSTQFIQTNPAQSRKQLRSLWQQPQTGLNLVSDDVSVERILEQIMLSATQQEDQKPITTTQADNELPDLTQTSCLILARFSHQLPKARELNYWQAVFPMLQIKCSTIHAAKGKEADYVIVLGNQQGQFGLPSEKQSHEWIQKMRQDQEDFPYAQERRVFYVAITRARQQVFLHYSESKPSVFIQEIQANGYDYQLGLHNRSKAPNLIAYLRTKARSFKPIILRA